MYFLNCFINLSITLASMFYDKGMGAKRETPGTGISNSNTFLIIFSFFSSVESFTYTQHTSTFLVSGNQQLIQGSEKFFTTTNEPVTLSLNTSMFAEVEKQYVARTPPSSPEPPSSVVSMRFTRH